MTRILVIDDDPALLRALRVGLHAGGHEVFSAANGEQGIVEAARSRPEVILLDLGLPDIDGITVCRRIRGWSEVPIIVLSATDTDSRKVAALDEGADDYVTKPFSMAELEARIRAAVRHRGPAPSEEPATELAVGSLELDLVHHQAHLRGAPLELTAKEFELLAFLARYVGKVCTRQMLLTSVWGAGYTHEAQYLHVYVHRLRQKIGEDAGIAIKTSPGIGYELVATEPVHSGQAHARG